jgi:hypothetical protein
VECENPTFLLNWFDVPSMQTTRFLPEGGEMHEQLIGVRASLRTLSVMPPGGLSSPVDDIVSGMGFWAGVEAEGEEDIVPAGEVGEIEDPLSILSMVLPGT